MTKKQRSALWKARDIGFEEGMIAGWAHIILLSRSCIRAHKKTLKQLVELRDIGGNRKERRTT